MMDLYVLLADILLVSTIFFIVFCIYGRWKQSHFKNTGVKYVQPRFPFSGNTFELFAGLNNSQEFILNTYEKFPEEKYIGLFNGFTPVIFLRDNNLIGSLGIKNFDLFHDHKFVIGEDVDAIFGNTLVSLTDSLKPGEIWKDMRTTLSPLFTTSNMKNIFSFTEQHAIETANFYSEKLNEIDVLEIDLKDMFIKYTVDAIASTNYGIKINSTKEYNDFYKYALQVSTNTWDIFLKFAGYVLCPNLMKFFGITLRSKKINDFFTQLLLNSMKYREENNIIRKDLVHLLMQVKNTSVTKDNKLEQNNEINTEYSTVSESKIELKDTNRKWSEKYLIAQSFLFFFGGFDSTAGTLAHLFYQLALNPDIQKRLHREIDEFQKSKLDYYDISKLKYLDMCISETLRMHPPFCFTDRVAEKDYTLPPPTKDSNKPYIMKAKELIWIPIYALHMCPENFPNPKKFDPERFSQENVGNILPNTFVPFGIGPRSCIGSRYALTLIKAISFHLLKKLEFVVTEKTEIPLVYDNVPFNLKAKRGVWVGLKNRNFRKTQTNKD